MTGGPTPGSARPGTAGTDTVIGPDKTRGVTATGPAALSGGDR